MSPRVCPNSRRTALGLQKRARLVRGVRSRRSQTSASGRKATVERRTLTGHKRTMRLWLGASVPPPFSACARPRRPRTCLGDDASKSDWRRVAASKEIDGVAMGAYKSAVLRIIERELVVSPCGQSESLTRGSRRHSAARSPAPDLATTEKKE